MGPDGSVRGFLWATLVLLGLGAGVPLLFPFFELLLSASAWRVYTEWDRLLELFSTSTLYLVIVLLVALPAGTLLGLLLGRTDLPGAAGFRFGLLLALLLPLPLAASGWQMLWTELGIPLSQSRLARLLAAGAIQGVLAWPWVALITGYAFRCVEPELEEVGLLATSPGRVVWHITLPRGQAGMGLAALWVALLAWQEITITDWFQLRTYAEEVYLQFNSGREELARALAASLPPLLLLGGVCAWAVGRYQRLTPPAERAQHPPVVFALGRWRWTFVLLVLLLFTLLLAAPVLGLLLKAGVRYATAAAPAPATWEAALVAERVARQLVRDRWVFLQSMLLAAAVGTLASAIALWLLFLGRVSPRCGKAMAVGVGLLLALPGPIVGVGLLATIQFLLPLPLPAWVGDALYYRPSPLPVLWVQLLRVTPMAWLLLWPSVRTVPLAMDEEVRLSGGRPLRHFRLVYWGQRWPALLAVAAAGATLALGEISASKLVATPGHLPLAHHLFLLMHASADAELASVGLGLLLLVAAGALGSALPWRRGSGGAERGASAP